MAYKSIGNAVAEWDDNEPFIFTISEEIGSNDDRRLQAIKCDLSGLRTGFEDEFLLYLKDFLIEWRHRIVLRTIWTEYRYLVGLFRNVIDHDLFDTKIASIDEPFLLALNSIKEALSKYSLEHLRRAFKLNPHSPLFAPELKVEDFPRKSNKKGHLGQQIDRILAKALTRSACVEILGRCEQAYEDSEMDIGHFSFINLAFAVYARPESYRQIRLDDLVHDTKVDTFFIYILQAKSGVHRPKKICYQINKLVGALLLKQRHHVIETYGHLVDQNGIGKLALFPARLLKKGKSGWASAHVNEHFGEYDSGAAFDASYFRVVREIVTDRHGKLNANSLRHTVGTQLAEAGCSAKTIQAVLKHATDSVCKSYVDIAFHGLINELSDAMKPTFETHLPVFQRFRSKGDFVQLDKAIHSEDIESGRTEMTGECGKQMRCEAAPFTCYECHKFIPCFDANHSVNHEVIQREIDEYKNAGTPYRHMLEKAKSIKYRIQLVMVACDRYQQAHPAQEGRS